MKHCKVNNLYHLSKENHNGEVFKPRVPDVFMLEDCEDGKIPRVCFSTTLSGAYRAINFDEESTNSEIYYVHVPENIKKIKNNIYQPNEDEVWDYAYTNEKWVRKSVKMKCIGKVRLSYRKRSFLSPWRTLVRIKWIESYYGK